MPARGLYGRRLNDNDNDNDNDNFINKRIKRA